MLKNRTQLTESKACVAVYYLMASQAVARETILDTAKTRNLLDAHGQCVQG